MVEDSVPAGLIINQDQTPPLKMVPVSQWTLEKEGAAQVPITSLDDKRQITAVLASTLDGSLLPLQLIYKGITNRCHPRDVKFPDGWDIWHSENHWSNTSTMVRYIEKVLVPWAEQRKRDLRLPQSQKAIVVLDVFRAHSTTDVLDTLKENNFRIVFVPGNCTSELQPLDLYVNGPFRFCFKTDSTTGTQSWLQRPFTNILMTSRQQLQPCNLAYACR